MPDFDDDFYWPNKDEWAKIFEYAAFQGGAPDPEAFGHDDAPLGKQCICNCKDTQKCPVDNDEIPF